MAKIEKNEEQKLKWQFNLDKAIVKSNETVLRDPLGYKCNGQDMIIRSNTSKSSNMTYVESLEAKAWAYAKAPIG